MPIRKNMKHTSRRGKEKTLPAAFRQTETPEETQLPLPVEIPAEKLLCDDSIRVMGEHAATIIHELKGPMQALTAQLQVMQTLLHKQGNTRHDQRFSLIYGEIDRLSTMIQQYLRMGKTEESTGEPLHLPTLAQETAQLLRSLCLKQGAELTVEDRLDFPMLNGDEGSIRRILVNLVINAAQAQTEPGHSIHIFFGEDGDTLSLTVENDGPPISCRPLEKVFQPRYTTKKNGTGLGLYASRLLAREYGGDLTVESCSGRTAFTLTLPRTAGEAALPTAALPEEEAGESLRCIS